MLKTVLNCRHPLPETWFLDYGMTASKNRTLLAPSREPNSFLNPGSETALTLFMLGNMDGWKQIGHFDEEGPRTGNDQWSSPFFSIACGLDGIKSYSNQEKWSGLNQGVFSYTSLDWPRATLLFEFEVMNSQFHTISGKAFKSLSFLNIQTNTKWGLFDAFMIVPAKQPTEACQGAFVGIEAKLGSDISRATKGFRYVNQVMRNVEAGYWLTHHPESLYRGWQFHYVFLCPKRDFELKATYYAWLLADKTSRQQAAAKYRDVLTYHGAKVDDQHYAAFCQLMNDRVSVVHWNQLADTLRCGEPGFIANYLGTLENETGCAEIHTNTRLRLQRAGIEIG